MDDKRQKNIEFIINILAGQENDEFYDKTGQIVVDIPKLEHFIIKKYVYSPAYFTAAMAWLEYISERTKNKTFLDMGTGSGVVATYVARNGHPRRVVATDISPQAIENTKANAEQYGLKEPYFQVYEGDVYSALKQEATFDVIFWNFPWNAPDQDIEEILRERNIIITPEKVNQLKAVFDKQSQGLRRFIADGVKYLNPGGEILLGGSELSRNDIIYDEAKQHGYTVEVAAEQDVTPYKNNDTKLKLILYRLTLS
jgi:methylase of polypeptide subunit release factors